MKNGILIGLIVVILAVFLYIGVSVLTFSADSGMQGGFGNNYSPHYSDRMSEDEEFSGAAQITSFNIEVLDTTLWSKVDKVLVNNEDLVKKDQEILNVSNEDSTGKIYSTISGKLFIEEGYTGNTYTIYDLDNLGFELQVPESYAKYLKIGQKVKCSLQVSDETVIGRVCYISHIPQNEQINVKVKLDNTEKIKIGYSVYATILFKSKIDSDIQVYDIKNSIPKIGKTVIKYKNTGEQFNFSSIEEMMQNDDITTQYEQALEEQAKIIEELSKQLEEMASGNEDIEYSEDEMNDYGNELMEKELVIEALQAQIEELTSKLEGNTNDDESQDEQDEEHTSEYYNEYWKEYWENYYKPKDEEPETDQDNEATNEDEQE